MDESDAGLEIPLLLGDPLTTLGSVFFPFLLTNLDTGERMRYVLKALVVPDMFMSMFIGESDGVVQGMVYRGQGRGPEFILECHGSTCRVQGM